MANSSSNTTLEESKNQEKEESVSKKKYKCTFSGCEASFLRPNRLQRHLNLHNNERPHKCTFEKCDKAYTNFSHLKRHLQTHDATKKIYKCNFCPSNMRSITNLKRHYNRIHNPEREMYCHECHLEFRKKNRFVEHMSAHNNLLIYKCDKCGRDFLTELKLYKHQLLHRPKSFKCPIKKCSEVFENWSMLKKHRKLEHSQFSCPKCSKAFPSQGKLNLHSKVHEENRPAIPCPYKNCHRLYYFNRNLQTHICIKHIGNKFTCDICGKKLATKQKIKLHIIQIHQSEKKPFKRKTPESRKDAGIAKKSMLSQLSGIYLLPTTEKKLFNRIATALLRDKVVVNNLSHSEDDRASDVSAQGA